VPEGVRGGGRYVGGSAFNPPFRRGAAPAPRPRDTSLGNPCKPDTGSGITTRSFESKLKSSLKGCFLIWVSKGTCPFGGCSRGRSQAPPVADQARRRPSEQGKRKEAASAATHRNLCELWCEAEPSNVLSFSRSPSSVPLPLVPYTLNRNSVTSPSCMTYSLPSERTRPFSLQACMEPSCMSVSKGTISARMKPRSKSV